jgi:solute carrier family 29 (equilibrative nucleoside transporter), member 1/2/3
MDNQSAMDRIRGLLNKPTEEGQYSRLEEDIQDDDEDVHRPVLIVPDDEYPEEPFSWFEYCIFLLLGISMLWAWYATIIHTKGVTV